MPTKTDKRTTGSGRNDTGIDTNAVRADFPILTREINGHPLVYLDSAASSQKPKAVINSIVDYYENYHSNVHRGLHTLAEKATNAYENVRGRTAQFIGAPHVEEVIFTRGATESINAIASAWGDDNVGEGDEIVITEMEHHANFVPWYALAKRKNAILKKISITTDGQLDLSNLSEIITERTKVVAVSHMSNVLGTINPIKELAQAAHKVGAILVADGAQAVPHMPVNVSELGVDFYAFSSHKMLGPTGVGVLWGKKEILEKMQPFLYGGEMIREVSFEKVTWADLPNKFEAGTPNIADVIGFEAALDYLENLGMDNIRRHEIDVTTYAIEQLSKLKGITIQGPHDATMRGGAISFTDADIHPHDISTFLDSKGIAVRAGHHCAQPLMRAMNIIATARASFYIYNDRKDVDTLCNALTQMRSYFGL